MAPSPKLQPPAAVCCPRMRAATPSSSDCGAPAEPSASRPKTSSLSDVAAPGSSSFVPSQYDAMRATRFSCGVTRAGSMPLACAASSERATSVARGPGPAAAQLSSCQAAALGPSAARTSAGWRPPAASAVSAKPPRPLPSAAWRVRSHCAPRAAAARASASVAAGAAAGWAAAIAAAAAASATRAPRTLDRSVLHGGPPFAYEKDHSRARAPASRPSPVREGSLDRHLASRHSGSGTLAGAPTVARQPRTSTGFPDPRVPGNLALGPAASTPRRLRRARRTAPHRAARSRRPPAGRSPCRRRR